MSSTISALTSGGGIALAGDTSGQLELKTNNGTTAVTVDTSQNVGINTTSPSYKLDVQRTAANGTGIVDVLRLRSTGDSVNDGPRLLLTCGNSTTGGAGIGAGGVALNSANLLFYAGGNTERMRITSGGELFVGTTTLAVTDATGNGLGWTGNRSLIVNSANSTTQALLYLDATSWTSGTINFEQFRLNGGTTLGTITSNGSTMTYGGTSDYRLKENIASLTGALAKVEQLKPSSFVWKNTGIADDGFIAHELQEFCPNAVVGEKDAVDEDGNPVYQQIDTSFLVATLTAALQELNAKVDAQALEIQALKGVA
jgi:hypothetical protein